MESLCIPLISGIPKHKALIACSHVGFVLAFMYCCGNICILSLYVKNHVAICAVKADSLAGEADFLAYLPSNGFKIDLGLINAHFSKEYNLSRLNKMNKSECF